jgi:hypothetical protein
MARHSVPRERFVYTVREPFGGMSVNVELHDLPATAVLRQRRTHRSARCCSLISSEASAGRLRISLRPTVYVETVDWLTSVPSLRSSSCMRGAPNRRLAPFIWRNSLRTSRSIRGLRDLEPTARANGIPLNQGTVDQTNRGATAGRARSIAGGRST